MCARACREGVVQARFFQRLEVWMESHVFRLDPSALCSGSKLSCQSTAHADPPCNLVVTRTCTRCCRCPRAHREAGRRPDGRAGRSRHQASQVRAGGRAAASGRRVAGSRLTSILHSRRAPCGQQGAPLSDMRPCRGQLRCPRGGAEERRGVKCSRLHLNPKP